MLLWLTLFAAFIIQEPVLANTVILAAYQAGYNVWIIHALFVVGTVIDIAVGYWLGYYLMRHARLRPLMRLVSGGVNFLLDHTGWWGTRIGLFVLGPIVFPLSALVPPMLDMPLWESMLLLFVGDAIFWYGASWLVVLGVHSLIPNPIEALFAIAAVTLVALLAARVVKKRLR